jgi:hypothetical protein
MIHQFYIILLLIVITAAPVFAGPPLLTDDPDTPGDQHWEINVAYTLDKSKMESTQETPILDLNYGLGDNIQLKYEIPWLINREQQTGTKSGAGNSLAGIKWRFLEEEKYGVNMSVYPQIGFNFPTSSAAREVFYEETYGILPVEVSKKFGLLTLDGEFGYTFNQHSENEWLYGLFCGYEIRENLTMLAEIHGGATTQFNSNETVFNIGTQWDFTKKYGLLASAGRSFSRPTSDKPNLLLYLGLQMRL